VVAGSLLPACRALTSSALPPPAAARIGRQPSRRYSVSNIATVTINAVAISEKMSIQ
jgi:hypothetical protein